jgi:WD40-like Beta Propeller Repeat
VPAAGQQEFQGFTDWAAPENLGPPLNTAAEESAPAISDDGLGLYFNRNPNLPDDRDEDLYVSRRDRPTDRLATRPRRGASRSRS